MLEVKLSLAPAPMETQVGHRYDAPPVEVWITSGRIAMQMFSAQNAEPGLMLQKCAMYPQKQV